MARVVWKGAIVFGMVYIPVSLYPGSRANQLDFNLLDRRDHAPVGYQRINKKTGKPVDWENIVKGYEYEDGQFVLMSDEDFRQANPEATQTVEILSFVEAGAIDPQYFDTPYRLVPAKRGEKGYALLRETLRRTGRIGVAQVVIRTKQHLAAVMPVDEMLVLETLRYGDEILPATEFEFPPAEIRKAGIGERELDMATRLVEEMTEEWDPARFHDTYREDLMARIEKKIQSGDTQAVAAPAAEEKGEIAGGAKVIDLMAALKRSLESAPAKPKQAAARRGGARTSRKAAAPPAASKRKRA
jgi:DNA end-binding protein Ku